jgi:hypothetical protein
LLARRAVPQSAQRLAAEETRLTARWQALSLALLWGLWPVIQQTSETAKRHKRRCSE